MDLTFTYRSRSAYNGVFGYGWDMTYNRRLRRLDNGNMVLLTGENRKDEFTWNGSGFDPPPGIYATLTDNGNGTHTLASREGLSETFDVNGNLSEIRDRNGNTLTFTYEGPVPIQGKSDYFVNQTEGVIARTYRVTQITDTVGRTIAFTYNPDGRLDTVTYAGRTTTYTYDPSGTGELISVTTPSTTEFPSGLTTTYAYDAKHNLTSITDPKGQTYLTNTYDLVDDRVTSQTYGSGTTTLTYMPPCASTPPSGDPAYSLTLSPLANNPGEALTVTWDVPAERAGFLYDWIGLYQQGAPNSGYLAFFFTNGQTSGSRTVFAGTNPDLYETRYLLENTYTDVARSNTVCVGEGPWTIPSATDVLDRNGNLTTYTFDTKGHITKMEQFTDGVPMGEPPSFVTLYEYNEAGEKTKVVLPRGNSIQYTYDDLNPDPKARGNLLTIRRKPIPPSVEPDLVTTFTYEPQYQFVKTLTDPRGNVTTYTYDYELGEPNKGNLRKIIYPMVDGQTIETIFTYNASGQVETVTDPNGNITRYTYDSVTGYLLSITNGDGTPDAATTSLTYDAFGNITSTQDPNFRTATFQYDALNQLIQVTAPSPLNFLTKYSYDENGNLRQLDRETRDALNPWITTTYAYTNLDQLQTITDELGNTTIFTYDANGNRTSIQDAELNTTTYLYDERNLLFQVQDANLQVTEYTYDENANLKEIKDANSNPTTYTYDDFDRFITTRYADLTQESYTYDAASNLTQRTDPALQAITYTYDALNRLTLKTYPNLTTVDYVYDVGSRLTQIQDPLTSISYQYDPLNRITQSQTTLEGTPNTVSYQYDKVGNRTRLTYPQGTYLTYFYDQLNRLTQLRQNNSVVTSYTYDALSRRTKKELYGGTTKRTTYTYDALSRLIRLQNRRISTGGGGGPRKIPVDMSPLLIFPRKLFQGLPNPFKLKNAEAVVFYLNSTFSYTYDAVGNRLSMGAPTGTHTYAYNNLYELTGVSGAQSHSYTHDPVGNRTLADGTSYTPNTLNQYSSVGGTPYTYDPNGNLTSDGTKTYAYDYENRLVSVTGPGLNVTYAYDGFGRRVKKTVNGIVTYYLHDGDQVIEERGSGGVLQATYTYGPGIDENLTMSRGGQTYYYFHDGLGSVTDLTQASGELVESYSYDVYGQPNAPPTVGNPYLYTGRELDPETGLYYYRARYYHPGIGRFMQRDPVGYIPDLNMYRYVGNNPTSWVDPFGFKAKNPYNAPGNQGNFPGGFDPNLPGFSGGPQGPPPPSSDPRPRDPSPRIPDRRDAPRRGFGERIREAIGEAGFQSTTPPRPLFLNPGLYPPGIPGQPETIGGGPTTGGAGTGGGGGGFFNRTRPIPYP